MFKLGDKVRVILILDEDISASQTIGNVFIIGHIHDKASSFPYAEVINAAISYNEKELVLDEVYKSSLYQALQEDINNSKELENETRRVIISAS